MDDNGDNEVQEQEEAQLASDAGRRGRLFVVNYGAEMFAGNGHRFRMALKAVRNQINDICCLGESGDKCAILFANTTKSNEKAENIDNMFVYRDMDTLDVALVKGLDAVLQSDPRTVLVPTIGDSGRCNWAELLYLCQKLLRYGQHFRKKFIHIFTTDREKITKNIKDQVKNRLDEIHNSGIELNVFILDDNSDESVKNEEMFKFWKTEVDPDLKCCSSFKELQSGLRFKNYALRSTTTLPFKMGDNFEFAVGLYYLIRAQGKPQAIMVDSETGERVERRVHFIPGDEAETANGAEEEEEAAALPGMMKGERFEGEVGFRRDVGGVDVVLEREDLEKLRRLDQPGITVIGFKPLKLLKDSYRMGAARFIYPIDSVISGSSALYRALLMRCLSKKLFILVRYTHKKNTPPKLCALVPQSSGDDHSEGCTLPDAYFYEGFHLLDLPYAENARSLEKRYQPVNGLGMWPSASPEQVDAAKEFIKKLINTNFSPDDFANPMLQQHYKAVETVALELPFDQEEFQREASENDILRPYFKNSAFEQRVLAEAAKFKRICTSEFDQDEKPKKGRMKKEMNQEESQEKMEEETVPKKRGRKAK